jgi:hypothetical protein
MNKKYTWEFTQSVTNSQFKKSGSYVDYSMLRTCDQSMQTKMKMSQARALLITIRLYQPLFCKLRICWGEKSLQSLEVWKQF